MDIIDQPRPLALYEMIHPPQTPREGELYRIVIYRADLLHPPTNPPPEEARAIIALTTEQVIQGLEHQPTIAELLDDGAEIVAQSEPVDRQVRVYPLGSAWVLAHVLRYAK